MLCMLSFINHYNILRCQSNKVTKAPNKARPADTKLFSPEIQSLANPPISNKNHPSKTLSNPFKPK